MNINAIIFILKSVFNWKLYQLLHYIILVVSLTILKLLYRELYFYSKTTGILSLYKYSSISSIVKKSQT